MTAEEMKGALAQSVPTAPVLVEIGGEYYEVASITIPTVEGLSVLIKVKEEQK